MPGARNYERLSHDDYCLELIPRRPRRYASGRTGKLTSPASLELAKTLLLAGERVGAVAEELGYAYIYGFSAAFCTATGLRPTAFVTKHQKLSGDDRA